MSDENNPSIEQIGFANAFMDQVTVHPLHEGGPSDIYPSHMKIYKVSGKFMLDPHFNSYSPDTQRLAIELSPKRGEYPFIVQPMLKYGQQAPDSEGWDIKDLYTSYEHQSVPIYDAKKLEQSVVPFYKSSFVWVAKRNATTPAALSAAPSRPIAPMGRRVALVIGNGAYKAVGELANPKNDAAAVAGQLIRLGFEVIEKHDLGVAAMRKALGEFEDKATGAEWALVYYSGHGMELNGKNWLIPVDAELVRATDTPDEAIPLERVLDRLAVARKLRIVVLDACRNNPFLARMVMNRFSTRAVARGLTAVEPEHGEVVFYAARDGSLALDGSGGNSPFAAALVKHMEEEGVELGRFIRRVTSTVLALTSNQQEPFVYGRLPDEDFYFKPPR